VINFSLIGKADTVLCKERGGKRLWWC
jgi:hypothetical protein